MKIIKQFIFSEDEMKKFDEVFNIFRNRIDFDELYNGTYDAVRVSTWDAQYEEEMSYYNIKDIQNLFNIICSVTQDERFELISYDEKEKGNE